MQFPPANVLKVFRGLRSPHDVELAPDGRYAYVTEERSGTVAVLSLTTRRIVRRVPVAEPARPRGAPRRAARLGDARPRLAPDHDPANRPPRAGNGARARRLRSRRTTSRSPATGSSSGSRTSALSGPRRRDPACERQARLRPFPSSSWARSSTTSRSTWAATCRQPSHVAGRVLRLSSWSRQAHLRLRRLPGRAPCRVRARARLRRRRLPRAGERSRSTTRRRSAWRASPSGQARTTASRSPSCPDPLAFAPCSSPATRSPTLSSGPRRGRRRRGCGSCSTGGQALLAFYLWDWSPT